MSQAIIGSLPKGLTDTAKAKIQASVPASPSAAALKELSMVRHRVVIMSILFISIQFISIAKSVMFHHSPQLPPAMPWARSCVAK